MRTKSTTHRGKKSITRVVPAGPKRVILYIRVSSPKQTEGGSLLFQEKECRDWCDERGWEVVAVRVEVHTRADFWERDTLSDVRQMLRDGAADVLLVWRFDRLSGDKNHVGYIFTEAARYEYEIFSATEAVDNSPMGKMLRDILAFVAEMDRIAILERTGRGQRARGEIFGRLRPGPRPLYGYRWRPVPPGLSAEESRRLKRAYLDIEPTHAAVVCRIFDAVAAGQPLLAIVADLKRDGIRRPGGGDDEWATSTIRAMLKNPYYMGLAYTNRGWQNGIAISYENATLLEAGTVPPIVTAQIWRAAQDALARNRKLSERNNRHPEVGLLRGYAICGHCGSRLHVEQANTGRPIYRCVRPGCAHRFQNILVSILDGEVSQEIRTILQEPDKLRRAIESRLKDDPTAADSNAIALRKIELTQEMDSLSESIANVTGLARATLERKLEERGEQLAQAERDEIAVERRHRAWQRARERQHDLMAHGAQAAQRWDTLDFATRRLTLEAFAVVVRLYPHGSTPRWEMDTEFPLPEDAPSEEVREIGAGWEKIGNKGTGSSIHKNALILTWPAPALH
jgi:DNA invertase Pin-like site-specific DNA recombinase